jgi:hypothetical protein
MRRTWLYPLNSSVTNAKIVGFGDSEFCGISRMVASPCAWGRKVMAQMAASVCGEGR